MIAFPQSNLRWAIHSAAALLSFSAAGSSPQRLRRRCISASAGDGRTTPKPSPIVPLENIGKFMDHVTLFGVYFMDSFRQNIDTQISPTSILMNIMIYIGLCT